MTTATDLVFIDKPQPTVRRWLMVCLVLLISCVAMATLLSLLLAPYWLADLVNNFRVYYFAFATVSMCGFLLLARYGWVVFSAIFILLNAMDIVPFFMAQRSAPVLSHHDMTKPLKVMTVNVNLFNHRYDLIANAIKRKDPDLLLIVEFNSHLQKALPQLTHWYPYSFGRAEGSLGGLTFYSKLPISQKSIVPLGEVVVPLIHAVVRYQNKPIHVFATHLNMPLTREWFVLRNHQLAEMADYIEREPGTKIAMGDFNITPWSWYFQQFVNNTKLHNSMLGFGVQNSWRDLYYTVRIPIDHILVTPDFQVLQRKVGPDIASDHLPVMVELRLLSQK